MVIMSMKLEFAEAPAPPLAPKAEAPSDPKLAWAEAPSTGPQSRVTALGPFSVSLRDPQREALAPEDVDGSLAAAPPAQLIAARAAQTAAP